MINMTRKIPRPYNTVRGEITRCTTLLPRSLTLRARGACNGARSSRPVQAGNSGASTTERLRRLAPAAGSLQGVLLRLFPFTVFCENQGYCTRSARVCQPRFSGKIPLSGGKNVDEAAASAYNKENTRRFSPLKRRRRSVILNKSSTPATGPTAVCMWATSWAP